MRRVLCFLLFVATTLAEPLSPGPIPDDVYRPWDGKWKGTFIVYDGRGREETRIQVEQEYTSVTNQLQTVVIKDTYPSGWTVTKRGTNYVANGELRCDVIGPQPKCSSHHKGSYLGPGVIYWYSLDDDGRPREWFYEQVIGDEYRIDGAGIYGDKRDKVKVYIGRYKRASE